MSRYIDADLLKQCVQDNITRYYTCGVGGYCLAEDVVEGIDNFPTADVVEVRHEHWVVCGAFDDFLKCSSCGYDRPWQTAIEHKYCPNCGAKMDGERSENGKS